jgi:hypothetical protein
MTPTLLIVVSLALALGYGIGVVTASRALRGQIADLRLALRHAHLEAEGSRDALTQQVLRQMPSSRADATRTQVVAPIVAMRRGGVMDRPDPPPSAIDARLEGGSR